MPATTLWTSAVAKTLYVRELGNVTSGPIAGVKACDALDVSNFDNTNYRDEFFDPEQTQSNLVINDIAGAATSTDYITNTTVGGVVTKPIIIGSGVLSSGVNSATDAVLHVPPRNEEKMRTQIRLWSGTPGSSDVLYCGWADEIVSFSLAPYTFI